MISAAYKQRHFVLYELILPYCAVCTAADGFATAWHTPITCDESSDGVYSLWFSSNGIPSMSPPSPSIGIKSRLNSSIFKCVTSGTESTPTLKPAEGLASRGKMGLTMEDFDGDPGPINFSEIGTFFGKLIARNILEGKKIKSHYYTIENHETTATLVSTSEHFIEKANLSDNKIKITGKDALKNIEAFGEKFPTVTEIALDGDINASTTTIPVSDASGFSAGNVVVIDKELMWISSISANNLTVLTRGATINGTARLLYKTEASNHSDEAAVQLCYVMDNAFLPDVLSDVITGLGLADYVNLSQWTDEITEWNSSAFLTGVLSEPDDGDDVINKFLTEYMVDMWLDQPTQKLLANANSSWRQAGAELIEGEDFQNLSISSDETDRYSRAYIRTIKEYQAENDDNKNFSRMTLFKDTISESDDLYGGISIKEFDSSTTMSTDSAFVLFSRYVQRFASTPKTLTMDIEERKMVGINLGDVKNFISRSAQSASGDILTKVTRAQIIEIKPDLNVIGRMYKVKALDYIPLATEAVYIISGEWSELNLHSYVGAPPSPFDATFVLDGATFGSVSNTVASLRAGNFAAGSTIKIICINGTKLSAKGGDGGNSFVRLNTQSTLGAASTSGGGSGGLVYNSNGVDTSLYLNYGDVEGYTTEAELISPGGGGGAAAVSEVFNVSGSTFTFRAAAASGGGGSGIPAGSQGTASRGYAVESISQGSGGAYLAAGVGAIAQTSAGNGGEYVRASSGNGGLYSTGVNGSYMVNEGSYNSTGGQRSTSSAGASGEAFTGGNITVYNLAADAAKFRDGSNTAGVDYTLVDA